MAGTITILYYEEGSPKEELLHIVQGLQEVTDNKILVLPKKYDLLFNCSLDQLLSVKAIIDTVIGVKFNEEVAAASVDATTANEEQIIDITQYLSSDDQRAMETKAGEIIKLSDYLS